MHDNTLRQRVPTSIFLGNIILIMRYPARPRLSKYVDEILIESTLLPMPLLSSIPIRPRLKLRSMKCHEVLKLVAAHHGTEPTYFPVISSTIYVPRTNQEPHYRLRSFCTHVPRLVGLFVSLLAVCFLAALYSSELYRCPAPLYCTVSVTTDCGILHTRVMRKLFMKRTVYPLN